MEKLLFMSNGIAGTERIDGYDNQGVASTREAKKKGILGSDHVHRHPFMESRVY